MRSTCRQIPLNSINAFTQTLIVHHYQGTNTLVIDCFACNAAGYNTGLLHGKYSLRFEITKMKYGK